MPSIVSAAWKIKPLLSQSLHSYRGGGARQVLELHFLKSGVFDLREEEEVIIKVFDDGVV